MARCLLLVLHKGRLCPASGGRKAFFLEGKTITCPWWVILFLSSIEASPLSGLLWSILAQFLPVALAPPRHHLRSVSLCLCFPLQVCSGSELCSSLSSISPEVLASAKQPVFGRAPGLLLSSGAATFQLSLHAI